MDSEDPESKWGCSPAGTVFGGIVLLLVGLWGAGSGNRPGGSVAGVMFGTAFILIGVYRLIREFRRNSRF